MVAIEIGLMIVSVGLCAALATLLVMRRRYRWQERAWDTRLQTAHEMTTAAQRETAVAMVLVTAAQIEAMAAKVEISVAHSRVVAAEEARMLTIAMAEAAQAEAVEARSPSKSVSKAVKTKKEHVIPKPATPCSCSQCQLESAVQSVGSTDADAKAHPLLPAYLWPYVHSEDVIPYALIKSKRGRQKKYNTEGYACPHLDCRYRGITDSATHALVAYGGHGRRERIQDLYCQACKRKITSRSHPAMSSQSA